MRIRSLVLISVLLAPWSARAGEVRAEAGVSYFLLRDMAPETGNPQSMDDADRWAPYVAGGYQVNDWFGIKLGYAFVNNLKATSEYSSPAGTTPAYKVWGHYRDDVHVVSLAPEFSLRLNPRVTLGVAPQLNWVSSSGRVSYSSNSPVVLLVAARDLDDDGFTAGGSAQVRLDLGRQMALCFGYQYLDLDPSFGRTAHVFSAGLQRRF